MAPRTIPIAALLFTALFAGAGCRASESVMVEPPDAGASAGASSDAGGPATDAGTARGAAHDVLALPELDCSGLEPASREALDVLRVAVGYRHACVLTAAGIVECWGSDEYRESSGEKPHQGSYIAVAARDWSDTCALSSDGVIDCWGKASLSEANSDKPHQRHYAALSGSCAVTDDGALDCWPDVVGARPASGSYVAVSGTCALTSEGTIECQRGGAVFRPTEGRYTTIGSGPCGVTDEGVADCWLDGKERDPETQAQPDQGHYAAASAAFGITCAVTTDGRLRCWGPRSYVSPSAMPSQGRYLAISVGDEHACAVTRDGGLECWEDFDGDSSGRLLVSGRSRPSYAQVSVGAGPCALTCEGRIECPLDEEIARPSPGKYAVFAVGLLDSALTQDGRLECAGETLSDGPYVAVSSSGYLAVSTRCCGSAISNRICALTPAGAVDCWSLDLAGDLSILTAVPEETAKRPARGHYTAISVGAAHACALINDGHVECWGTDQAVLLPEPTSRTSEGAVSGSPQDGGYTAVSAGNGYTCAIDSDGVAECWGYDEFGQVSGDKPHERGYVAISAGFRAACALTREGEVDCWGGDEYGQATDPKPRQGQYVAVSVGWSVACALTRSGAYDCWGQQYFSSDGPVWSASAL